MFGFSISIPGQNLHNCGIKGKKGIKKVQVDEKDTKLVHE